MPLLLNLCHTEKNYILGSQVKSEWVWVGNGNDLCCLHGARHMEDRREKTESWQWNTAKHMDNKFNNPLGGKRFALFQQDTFELQELQL